MTAPPSTWELSLAGGPPEAIARWLLDALFGGRAPQALSLDFRRRPAGAGWAAQLLADSRAPRGAFFDGPGDEQLVLHPAGTVVATVAWSGLPTDALGLLAAAPFEVAAFGSRHASWRSGRSKYLAPGFGRLW